MVGLDIVGHVAANQARIRDERSDLSVPEFFRQMIERKWLGDKTSGGFYRISAAQARSGWRSTGRPWNIARAASPRSPRWRWPKASMTSARGCKRLIGNGRQKLDQAGQFLWTALSELWLYSANRIPEIADSVADIDRAMRLGFNWELGPFELWDAVGVDGTVERMRAEGRAIPCNVERLLHGERHCWYENAPGTRSGRRYFDLASGECEYKDEEVPVGVGSVTVMKKSNGEVKRNAGASLIDLGDGVGCIEFHSKMNAIGADIGQLISQTLGCAKGFEPSPGTSGSKSNGGGDFEAFVITNDAANFSVGANLMLLLMAMQEQEWDEIDRMVRAFQSMTQAIKFSPKPVVVAPFNLTLGGGCEIALHAPVRQPHAELYMGLVETGVGLLPAGGGCKEMLLRALDAASAVRPARQNDGRGESVEVVEGVKRAFETIAMAKVSTSALEARSLGFLLPADADLDEPRARPRRRQTARTGNGESRLQAAGSAHRRARARREPAGDLEAGRASHAPGRLHQRSRGEDRQPHRRSAVRRSRFSGNAGQRTVSARPGARALQGALRRKEDGGAHRLHAENRQGDAELSRRQAERCCQEFEIEFWE